MLLRFIALDHDSLVALMVSSGLEVNFQDEHGMTPLHHAAASGERGCLRILVACGRCDYLIRDHFDRYASDIAIEWGRDYAAGRLLVKKQIQQAMAQGVPAALPPNLGLRRSLSFFV